MPVLVPPVVKPSAPAPVVAPHREPSRPRMPMLIGLFFLVAVLSIAGLRWMRAKPAHAPHGNAPASQEVAPDAPASDPAPASPAEDPPGGGGNG